jgi:HEAT repeat protein
MLGSGSIRTELGDELVIPRLALLGVLVLLSASTAAEAPVGPSELRAHASEIRSRWTACHEGIRQELAAWRSSHGETRPESVAVLVDLVGRFVPGGSSVPEGPVPSRERPEEVDRAKLGSWATRMARVAKELKRLGLGASAVREAYLAWRLDPGCREASDLLGYVEKDGRFVHPRRRRDEAPVSGSGESWEDPRVIGRAFFEIHTLLPAEDLVPWAARVDAVVEWMRSCFAGAPGWKEPTWPLVVRIYRNPEEGRGRERFLTKRTFAYWHDGHGVVNAAAFRPGSMPMENVVQHELAHGILEAGFPTGPKGSVVSGWWTEAFGQWIYAASADRPLHPRYWWQAEKHLGPVLAALRDGRDVVGELRRMPYAASRTSELAGISAMMADWCADDPVRWEGFARFAARYVAYRESRTLFEELFGPSSTVSRQLTKWARERTKAFDWESVPTPEGGAGGLVLDARFLQCIGIDVATLREAVGDDGAARIAEDALTTFVRRTDPRAALARLEGRWAWRVTGVRIEEVRRACLQRAGVSSGGESSIRRLVAQLAAPETREPARAELIRRAKEALPELFRVLDLRPKDHDHRHHVSEVIRQIGSPAQPGLLRLLREGSRHGRHMAAYLLGRIRPFAPEVVAALAEAIHDEAPEVRMLAGSSLGRIGPEAAAAVPSLLRAVREDETYSRLRMIDTLGKIGVRSVEVLAALRAVYAGEDTSAALSASSALWRLGVPAAEVLHLPIREVARRGPKREYAARILGHFGREAAPAVPHLIPLLEDDNWGVRGVAALALGEIGVRDDAVLDALRKLMDDPQKRVRYLAREALRMLAER